MLRIYSSTAATSCIYYLIFPFKLLLVATSFYYKVLLLAVGTAACCIQPVSGVKTNVIRSHCSRFCLTEMRHGRPFCIMSFALSRKISSCGYQRCHSESLAAQLDIAGGKSNNQREKNKKSKVDTDSSELEQQTITQKYNSIKVDYHQSVRQLKTNSIVSIGLHYCNLRKLILLYSVK